MSINFNDVFNSSDFNINNPKLEEFFNKTKDVAETVGRRSVERLDISKKKIDCLDAKAKLTKKLEQLGEIYYKSRIGEEPDEAEVEAIVTEITELKERLEALKEEIEIAKTSFNESMSNMAQKTKDAFKNASHTESVNVEVEVEVNGEE